MPHHCCCITTSLTMTKNDAPYIHDPNQAFTCQRGTNFHSLPICLISGLDAPDSFACPNKNIIVELRNIFILQKFRKIATRSINCKRLL